MPSLKRQFGDIGEKEAEKYLLDNGFKIIERNFRIKNLGEIDIIGEKDKVLVFFEVKTRSVKHETIYPIETSINVKKRKNLMRICKLYLAENKISPNKNWRVDAVFVRVGDSGEFSIEHLENVLWEKYY